MKKRWISLLLVLALVLAVWSVCAVAADAQKSDETAEETAAAEPAEEAVEEAPAEEPAAPAEEAETAPEDAEAPAEDGEQNHIHAVNRKDSCEEPSFAPLTVTGGKLESGCYYLTEDWTLDEPLCVAKNGVQVTLCLNGYSLSLADGAEGCIIYLAVSDEGAEPSVLTITDCNGAGTSSNYYVGEAGELIFDDGSFAWQEAYIAANEKNALAGGRITGATAGAISVGDYNQLYLSGVNIIDNEGRYGAGVVIAAHAKAVIDSCVIAGNRLTGEMKASERQILGGGVYCAGELELCGTTNLTGNRAQDAQNNLWLDETGTVTIGALGLDKLVMMTGDSERTAAAVAKYAGVDEYYAEVLPEDKAAFIRAEHEKGRKVIMIGDGVNDSPALSEADAGVAISTGAAIAREIADITIASEDLFELVTLRRLSQALMARIHRNYRFIVGFNLSLILLGVAGILPPTASALLHNMSTLGISLKSMTDLQPDQPQ